MIQALSEVQREERRYKALLEKRSEFEPLWKDISKFCYPVQQKWFVDDRRGDRRSKVCLDPTASQSLQVLTAGFSGGFTSASKVWFGYKMANPDLNKSQAVKVWLGSTRDRISDILISSNFYTVQPLVYQDLGAFGTSAYVIEEDDEEVIHCKHLPMGTYCLAADSKGKVNTIYRDITMTVEQIINDFCMKDGEEDRNAGTKELWNKYDQGNLDQELTICHAVKPNKDYNPKYMESKFKKYKSCYWLKSGHEDKFLRESGMDWFPVIAPRWEVIGSDVYGVGPAARALGLAKGLQAETKDKLEAITKMVSPPIVVPAELRDDKGDVNLTPNGVTYIPRSAIGTKAEALYNLNLRLDYLLQDIHDIRSLIHSIFFVDLFLMLSSREGRPDETATEIMELKQEKMMVLGPVLERLNDEKADPEMDIIFEIAWRRGLIEEPPQEVMESEDSDINVEYVSVMAQAAKLTGVTALQQLRDEVLGLAGAGVRSALDKFDEDEYIDSISTMLNTPPGVIRETKVANKARLKRAQDQQAMAGAAMADQMAKTVKTLGDTQVTDQSVLNQMMTQASGM